MKSRVLIGVSIAILSSIFTIAAIAILNDKSVIQSIVPTRYSTNQIYSDTFDQEQEIGVMVKQLQVAIKSSQSKESLQVIYEYGTDSRYYSMIRGWLVQELSGVESQLNVSQSELLSKAFTLRADFLKQAIRLIDLE